MPQVLNERELTGGNGMVEMGTFVAILLGQVVGGLLVALPGIGHTAVAVGCIALALAGRLVAQFIPSARPPTPVSSSTGTLHRNLAQPQAGAWQRGGVPLAAGHQLDVVLWRRVPVAVSGPGQRGAARQRAGGLAAAGGVLRGHGVGSLLCEVLSRRHVEIGLVPLGAIGMSVFAVDLYFATRSLPAAEMMGAAAFLRSPTTGACCWTWHC